MHTHFIPNKKTLVFLSFLFISICAAQERITKEVKIILAVNQKSEIVEFVELLVEFQKMNKDELLKRYNDHKFFLGILEGSYSPNKHGISIGNKTTITMYTNKQFFPSDKFSTGDDLLPGDTFKLGNVEGEVLANSKGELKIKTKNW